MLNAYGFIKFLNEKTRNYYLFKDSIRRMQMSSGLCGFSNGCLKKYQQSNINFMDFGIGEEKDD
jgi:hypothetical protein